jgi:Tfp pilus assembly protein FimT
MIIGRNRIGSMRHGVSMIEALVVVVLISVTASAAILGLSSVPPIDPARQAAQSFVTAIREARELAIKKQSPVTITLDNNSNPARWIFDAAAGAHGAGSRWDLITEVDSQVDGTAIPIRIDASGNASYFGEWKIRGTGSYQVTLEPMGGRVTMKSLD